MVAVSPYLLIFASVVGFGYNISLFIENFGSFEKKIGLYREILGECDETPSNTRKVNFVQNILLLSGYVGVAYLAGFLPWVLVLIFSKFAFSCYLSDRLYRLIMNREMPLSHTFYRLHKVDSLLNGILCAFLLFAIVL